MSKLADIDLGTSVIAVPPLALDQDGRIDPTQNRRIMRWVTGGAVTMLLYGGNANLANMPIEATSALLELLSEAPDGMFAIPSIGADLGKAMAQAALLRDMAFPTAMLLPPGEQTTSAGTATALRRLADRAATPLVAYLKREDFLHVEDINRLWRDGVLSFVKYAIPRTDPSNDAYALALTQAIPANRIVSGFGERPALAHMRRFSFAGYTSGSVCIAPSLSASMLACERAGRHADADRIRELFIPLEDVRDRHSPIRVLHAAVEIMGIARTGPLAPYLSSIDDPQVLAEVESASTPLRSAEVEARTSARAA